MFNGIKIFLHAVIPKISLGKGESERKESGSIRGGINVALLPLDEILDTPLRNYPRIHYKFTCMLLYDVAQPAAAMVSKRAHKLRFINRLS